MINDNFKFFHKYLSDKDVNLFKELLANLGSSSFTLGLGLAGSIPTSFIKKIYSNNFVFKNIKILKEKNFSLKQMDMDIDFGNIMYYEVDKTKINSTSLSHLFYATEILDLDQEPKNMKFRRIGITVRLLIKILLT